jgi:hypothetical protein
VIARRRIAGLGITLELRVALAVRGLNLLVTTF